MAASPPSKTLAGRLMETKNQLVDALGMLNSIWDDIGLKDNQKEDRLDLVFMYIRNLIEEMVVEEEKRRSTLQRNIKSYKEALSTLCAELNATPFQSTANRLYEIEAELMHKVQCWEKEKESRLTELRELKIQEQALCDIMQTTPTYISKDTIPSVEQLLELRKKTDQLSTEKAKRFEEFIKHRTVITETLADLGQEVITEFEQDVVVEDPECFVLSEANMVQLKVMHEKLELVQVERIKSMDVLQEKIVSLWNRLSISVEEREGLLGQITDHSLASIQLLTDELDRCGVLKFEHLQEFTVKVRKELHEWWNKCHYSKQQREAFTAFTSEEFSEEVLIMHEDALEAVKFYYAENEQLLRKIEKRTVLWNQMVAFDEKENDVNRFRNRGGNLLAEEREKKKVLHQLPKVEEQLKKEVEQWEEEHDRLFLIGGVQFFEYCRLQWEEYKLSKELQKQQRVEQKEKEMQSELRFGSKPTPSKRRFCAATGSTFTPKQRKLNDTTRSSSRLPSLSRMHSVFTSPAAPAKTPLRQSKTTSSLHTPVSARKPPMPRTPMSTRAPPKTPMSTMGPPRTPMSTRSTIRQQVLKKAKSCASLASPTLAKSTTTLAKSTKDLRATAQGNAKGKQQESKSDQENMTPSSCSSDTISEVEPVSSYEEFENLLDSNKKKKQYRSTICPPK